MEPITADPGSWPKWEVRLEAEDDDHPCLRGHFRVTTLRAPTEEEAVRFCERKEYRAAAYELPAHEAEALERVDAHPSRQITRDDRARLYTHRQRKPYRIASVHQVDVPKEA